MKEIWLNDSRNSQLGRESRHAVWHESAMSAMIFSNVTVYTSRATSYVYTSRATSYGVTQLLVAPRSLARPKRLVLANIDWGVLFLKFYFKKG
jgi:hypothetical protein